MEGEEVCRTFLHEKCEVRNGWGLVGVVVVGGGESCIRARACLVRTHAHMHVW